MHFCTIIAKNYVAQARVLAESFLRENPDGKFSVLFVDDPKPYVDSNSEPYEVITVDALDFPSFERMAAMYDAMELSTAVKPWFLKHLITRGDASTVTYLDPDIEVFGDLSEIARLAEEHGLVLTPHFTDPLPRDGKKPGEGEILAAGTYNLGFISLGRDAGAEAVLDWWSERLENDCLNDPRRGLFVDQRWMDLVPGFFPNLHILRDPGYNVAYWNLATRKVEKEGDRLVVNGQPLRFFHFSGFDPRDPEELSRHQNRIDLRGEPVLSELCAKYARATLAHGYEEASHWPYDWRHLPDGSILDRDARRLYREGVLSGRLNGSVFSRRGARALVRYLNEPTEGAGAGVGITRYMRAFYDARPDLKDLFPNLDGEDGPLFSAWLAGGSDVSIAPAFLGKASRPPASLADSLEQAANGRKTAESLTQSKLAKMPWGVNLAGYLNAELGVGEAARQMIAALDAEDIPVTPLGIPVEAGRMEHEFSHVQAQTGPFAVNVICVNADMLPLFAGEMGSGFFAGRHSIGLWFWEVSKFPERWMSSFEHLDEVWAASQHVADAVEAVSPIPVHTIRLPVVPVPPASRSRESLGLPDAYCFLFVFDHNSVLERKNPLGLIESFRRAFEPGSGPHLVLKTINGNRHPEDVKRVRAAVAEHPDVHLIEGYLPAEEKSAMIASCDCYVSLHRSEGFGLTMAEAMYFGKPTIATGYSGNLDFMTPDNSYLVDYRTRAIGDDADPYPTDGEWADPDLSHAASLMRQVFEEQEAAAERGRAAAADIRRTHSPHAAGEVIARQLEPVRAAMEGASGRVVDGSPSPPDLTTGPGAGAAPQASGASIVRAPGSMRARRLLERGVSPPRAGTGRIRRFLRGITLRAMKPFTEYQRAMNRNLVDSMGDLQRRIGELQFRDSGADHAAVLAAFRRYDRELGAIRAQLAALEHADQQRGPFEDFEHPSLGTVTGFRALPVAGSDSGVGSDAPGPESTEAIRERQHVYLELLADRAPVLEADCGPGEFLDRLREVDDGSLGAVLSAGLVQRLEFEGLRVFLELSLCKLKPGGLFIAEVTYPSGLLPDLFLTHCRMAGFAPAFVFDPDHYASAEADPLPASRYAIVATAPREESG